MKAEKTISKAFKFKAYPNEEQRRMIDLNCDAATKAWNLALELRQAYYELHRDDPKEDMVEAHKILHREGQKKSLSAFDLGKMVRIWKDTVVPWFAEADAHATRNATRDLDLAFAAFFRRVREGEKPYGYPKRKKRRTRSYRTQNTKSKKKSGYYESIRVLDNTHILMPKLGPLKVRGDLSRVEGTIQNATVRVCPSGRYEISVCCQNVTTPEMEEGTMDVMGVRLGVRDGIMRSDGILIENPKSYKKAENKLRREQRRLSRKKKGSKNYEKQRKRKAKVDERVSNMRNTCMHKATKQIVRDSKAVAVGKLDVKGMTKKQKGQGRGAQKKRNRATLDAATYETRRQLEYKCDWYGRGFVALESGIPWTRTCSRCGLETGPTEPGVKKWTCPECGTVHDTAMNAARNIAAEGSYELSKL